MLSHGDDDDDDDDEGTEKIEERWMRVMTALSWQKSFQQNESKCKKILYYRNYFAYKRQQFEMHARRTQRINYRTRVE